jgi:hypothetical protein
MYAGLLVERENRQQTDRERKKKKGKRARCTEVQLSHLFSFFLSSTPWGAIWVFCYLCQIGA